MEDRAAIYVKPLRKKKVVDSTETTNNDSLPSLPHLGPAHIGPAQQTIDKTPFKANSLRHELNETKHQISLMKSKLKNLQHLKSKYQIRRQQNMEQAAKMEHAQERVESDRIMKQEFLRKRQRSIEVLRTHAEAIKDGMQRAKRDAIEKLLYRNIKEAENERNRHRQHEYLIEKLREMDREENSLKASKIKEYHQQLQGKNRQFRESRMTLSKINYNQKVEKTLKERENASRLLQKLKKDEQSLLGEVQHSEKAMLTSLYSLGGFKFRNPQCKNSDRSLKIERANEEEDIYDE